MPQDIALQFGHSDFGDLVRKLYGEPNDELQLERLEQIMRNRTIPITVRVTPEPPTDLEDDSSPLDGTRRRELAWVGAGKSPGSCASTQLQSSRSGFRRIAR